LKQIEKFKFQINYQKMSSAEISNSPDDAKQKCDEHEEISNLPDTVKLKCIDCNKDMETLEECVSCESLLCDTCKSICFECERRICNQCTFKISHQDPICPDCFLTEN
jgi:hypothetical protein